MSYRGRFAPSPTGALHFGSLVAAVASHAEARHREGVWLVRIEDLDPPREVTGAADQMIVDLERFGMVSDEPVLYQSQRRPAYLAALATLREAGELFDCACSRRHLPKDGVYRGRCRDGLPEGEAGRSVRVRVRQALVEFVDRVQGPVRQALETEVGDFIVRRADGLIAYQLAVVVDDAFQGITDVVRGSDLLDSTPRQIHLQQVLSLPTPDYAHVPVAVDQAGQKLSKQAMALPVDPSRPMPALLSSWSFLGQDTPPPEASSSVDGFWRWAVEAWRLERIPKVHSIVTEEGRDPTKKSPA